MFILAGKYGKVKGLGLACLALAMVAAAVSAALAGERDEVVAKLGFDPIEQPTVQWLDKVKHPNADAEAKAEAEMKPYTETLPVAEVKFDMVPIKGGTFKLGSPDSEADRKPDEGPQVEVTLEPFWMGKCEVTWDEFEAWSFQLDQQRRKLKGNQTTPADQIADAVAWPTKPYTDMSFDMGKGNRPAICMTQYGAQMYCKWLSAKTGRYYRLPTEAEWEYACRAGSTTAYSFGDDPEKLKDYGWFASNANDKYQRVGTKKPNAWGLHDMHGNVCEWVLDQYVPDHYKTLGAKPVNSPLAVPTKEYPRCVRGGSWQDDAEALRSAARRGSNKDWKMQDPQIPQSIWFLTDAQFLGFRVVRPLRTPTAEEAKLYEPNPQIYKDYVAAQGGKQ